MYNETTKMLLKEKKIKTGVNGLFSFFHNDFFVIINSA
jgi:hypothetical protein